MPIEPIRTVLIGTGSVARSHVQALRSAGDRVEFTAAMDIDADRVQAFCAEHNVPSWYADAGELLHRESPQLVLIASPSATHCDLSVRCLEAGAWVLCEKPLCGSLAEMDRIEDAERRTGNYCASVRFASGAMANMTNSALSPRESSYVRLDTQKATVELTHLYRYTNDDWRFSVAAGAGYEAELETELEMWRTFPEDYMCSHDAQLLEFLDSMEAGERPAVSGPDVRRTIEFPASLYKSAMLGEPVQRGSIGPGDPFYHRMCGPCTAA